MTFCLSEATQHVGHGWGFGLHAAMDQAGALIGPLIMAASVARSHQFNSAFLVLAIPALGALIALGAARFLDPWSARAREACSDDGVAERLLDVHRRRRRHRAWLRRLPTAGLPFPEDETLRSTDDPAAVRDGDGNQRRRCAGLGRLFDRFGLAVLAAGLARRRLLALPLGFLGGQMAAVAAVALVGGRNGGAGRDASCRHLAGCVDEQARQCVRHVQRVLWHHVVCRQLGDGQVVRHEFARGTRGVRSRRPARGGRDVPSAPRSLAGAGHPERS